MSTSTDWSSRPTLTALSPQELAALVDSSIARTEGLLFTATATEELDAIGRWQQLRDQAFAGQMREIVAAYNRASGAQREFAADEVGLAIGATSTTGGNLVAQALSLAELPGLLEAVEGGLLTERHVLAVLRELDKIELTLEQRHAVVLVMLARYRGQAPGELGRLVARLIVQVDRAAAAARDAKAAAGRRVWFSRDVDGQATVIGRGPAAQIAAIRAALEATLPEQPDADDERSRDARAFDLFVDLLTGSETPGTWQAEIIVPFSVAEGGDLELAEIPGLGPILPATARDLLDSSDTTTQIAVDDQGQVIAVSDPIPTRVRLDLTGRLAAPPILTDLTVRGYVFSPRLRRFLQARDRTCIYPGCGRPARRCDKDHRNPWPGGATSAANGQCLCRHHHRAKQAVFTVTLQPDGSYRWATRGHWHFHRQPQGF
ncbi:MAG: HNH endonuclease signature motif containing protein [Mycobacteriales bacterium]